MHCRALVDLPKVELNTLINWSPWFKQFDQIAVLLTLYLQVVSMSKSV